MGDLISLLVNYSQKVLAPKLMLSQELEAVVLEVRWTHSHVLRVTLMLYNCIGFEGFMYWWGSFSKYYNLSKKNFLVLVCT